MLEAYGLGRPRPAVSWLTGQRLPVALAAPADWRPAVEARVGPVEAVTAETWVLTGPPEPRDAGPPVAAPG